MGSLVFITQIYAGAKIGIYQELWESGHSIDRARRLPFPRFHFCSSYILS
jgi:hypothetical protein